MARDALQCVGILHRSELSENKLYHCVQREKARLMISCFLFQDVPVLDNCKTTINNNVNTLVKCKTNFCNHSDKNFYKVYQYVEFEEARLMVYCVLLQNVPVRENLVNMQTSSNVNG